MEEPTKKVEVFESKNWILYVNQNIMSIVRFNSGPVKFTLGWLDRVDRTIRKHLTQQGMLMKRGMVTSRLYMKPDDMGFGLKSSMWRSTSSSSSGSSSSTSGEPSSDRNGSGGWRRRQRGTEKECG